MFRCRTNIQISAAVSLVLAAAVWWFWIMPDKRAAAVARADVQAALDAAGRNDWKGFWSGASTGAITRFERQMKAGIIAKFEAEKNPSMAAQYRLMRPGVLVEFVGKHDHDYASAFLVSWTRMTVITVEASGDKGFVKLREPGKDPGTVPLVREGGRWRLDFNPRQK